MTPHSIKDWWTSKHRVFRAFLDDFNRVAKFVNELNVEPPLQAISSGPSMLTRIDPAWGTVIIPVKITGAKSGSYYPGSVFGSGTASAATSTGENILLTGWDIDSTDTQGYLPARRILVGIADVYEVIAPYPLPPSTGNYFLRSVAGQLKWIQEGTC